MFKFVMFFILFARLSKQGFAQDKVGILRKSAVSFIPAQIRGEAYVRPLGSSSVFEFDEIPVVSSSCSSNQIHITLGDTPGSIIVSFASNATSVLSTVQYSTVKSVVTGDLPSIMTATGYSQAYSTLMSIETRLIKPSIGAPPTTAAAIVALQNTAPWAFDPSTGQHWANWYNVTSVAYGLGEYNNPYMVYDSPIIHTVKISNLTSGSTYYYRVNGSCNIYEFTVPRDYDTASTQSLLYPFKLGMTGDIGQTKVSVASMNALAAMGASAVLLAGDLSYADGYIPRWDSFGSIFEFLGAEVPILTTGGNHEIGASEAWQSYQIRYPTPHLGSGSRNFCYWGREVGVVHVIALCSYAGFNQSSLQYEWLHTYLSTSINRTRTPWIIAMMHVPFYNSNNGHWMEGELMRLAIEPLLYQYGVDVVVSGHVHSYERTEAIYNFASNPCGATYLNLGDGGNYEGTYTSWQQPAPAWSVFREASFGVGEFVAANTTHASFSWHRHACQSNSSGPPNYNMNFSDSCVTFNDTSAQKMLTSDMVWISRPPASVCSNKWLSTSKATAAMPPGPAPVQAPAASPTSSSSALSPTVIGLIVGVCILGVFNAGLIAYVIALRQRLVLMESSQSLLKTAAEGSIGSSHGLTVPAQRGDDNL